MSRGWTDRMKSLSVTTRDAPETLRSGRPCRAESSTGVGQEEAQCRQLGWRPA